MNENEITMKEQETIKEAFKTIIEMCGKISCRQCPMSYHDGDGDYLCNFERKPPHACELREVKMFEPHWEEFEVNEDGCFRSDGDLPCKWYRWFDFLNTDADRYNGFGGWLYNDGERQVWTSNPCIGDNDGVYAWAGTEDEVKPAIPVKIRFWRYAE